MENLLMKVMLEQCSDPTFVSGMAPSIMANLCREALIKINDLEDICDDLEAQLETYNETNS